MHQYLIIYKNIDEALMQKKFRSFSLLTRRNTWNLKKLTVHAPIIFFYFVWEVKKKKNDAADIAGVRHSCQ